MGGGGKVNAQLQQQQAAALQTQNQLLAKAMETTPEQKRFQESADAFDKFKKSGDYSKPPSGELLNFDLWNPAHVSNIQRQEANITGTGATALGMGGDDSIALGLARQRQNREDAQNAGAGYENAVHGADDYYRGNSLPWAQLQTQKYGNLFGTQSNNANNATDQWIKFASRPSPWASILGSALGAAGQVAGAYVGKPCWIAEAIYGPTDYRVMLLRSWLLNEYSETRLGRSVVGLYKAIGRQVAALVRLSPRLKRMFTPLFEQALTRALNDRYAV